MTAIHACIIIIIKKGKIIIVAQSYYPHLSLSISIFIASPPTSVSTTHQANTRTTPRVSTTSLDGAPRRQSNPRQVPRTSMQQPRQQLLTIPEEQSKSLVDQLALFSIPNIMLIGLMLPRVNVELDTEAHLPNRREAVRKARTINRIKIACGCFWRKLL